MMANIETVCPCLSHVRRRRRRGRRKKWKEKKIHFHLKKMDFVSNYLLVCTLHVINWACGARDDDEKVALKGANVEQQKKKRDEKKIELWCRMDLIFLFFFLFAFLLARNKKKQEEKIWVWSIPTAWRIPQRCSPLLPSKIETLSHVCQSMFIFSFSFYIFSLSTPSSPFNPRTLLNRMSYKTWNDKIKNPP